MKKIISRGLIILGLTTIVSITSCSALKPKLLPENIVDDNYRNWYEIYVGSFYDSDGNGYGDLKGVEMKLDYIKDTGYNGIWLMPIFKSPSYHKYDASDYYMIDPLYGSMQDLKDLIDSCHQKGIRLILDLVLNHSSVDNSYFDKSKKAYAKYLNSSVLTPEEEEWKDVYSFSPTYKSGYTKTYVSGAEFYYESNFDKAMPEFNFDSPKARSLLKDIMNYYLDLGLDGYRLDAVKYFYYRNNTKNYEVLNDFYNEAKKKNPNVYFVGECWDTTSTIANYYSNCDMDSFFYFPTSNASSQTSLIRTPGISMKSELFINTAKELVNDAHGHVPAPFIDNHDMVRAGEVTTEKYKLAFGMLSMLNGGLYHYYGDEIGLSGRNPPDQNVRTYMYWDSGNFQGKCFNPAGTTECEYVKAPLTAQINDGNSIYSYIKESLRIRNSLPSIARGSLIESECKIIENTELIVLQKKYNDEEIRIIINNSENDEYTYNYQETKFNDVVGTLNAYTDRYISASGNKIISLPPYSIAVIK